MTYACVVLFLLTLVQFVGCTPYPKDVQTDPAVKAQRFPSESFDGVIEDHVDRMIKKGRDIFRYDTFGSETFWGDQLFHEAIAGEKRRSRAGTKEVFNGKAACARCHVPPLFTEPGWPLHTGEEIGIDDFQANRSPEKRYRTTPLRGLFVWMKGGFYHDGRFATLEDVVNHYDSFMKLNMTASEQSDIVEYLKSL